MSIRTKLFLLFTGIMVVFVLCGVLLNTVFLEPFYVYRNRDSFVAASERISVAYDRDRKAISDLLRTIDRADGISSTIADRNMYVLSNSFPQGVASSPAKLPSEIEQLLRGAQEPLDKAPIYATVQNPEYQDRDIVFVTKLGNGDVLVLKKPMKGISESTAIANQFFVLTGCVAILVGGALIFLFSARIAKPVIEMSSVAESIANLDFSKRVTASSGDEIGSLANSINKMSERLSSNINVLREDVERRKLLVRNMSHELKTPIGVVKGYAEGLKFGVADDREKAEKYCSVIAAECDRMDGMIRELLDLSAMESGTFKLNPTIFDARELVGRVAELLSPSLEGRGIALVVKGEAGVMVEADPELIQRVVTNFVTNALNHVDERRRIEIRVEKANARTRIAVFNTGGPIEPGELERIWDVFYKIDKARSRQYGGHGLGLSIARSIAQLHGGRCWAENADEGVLFTLEMN